VAEYQRHPLARPHDVGQDFWAVGYAGPSLWDRQKYIDPRTGQVWESLEEALKYMNVEASIPDIRSSDIWRGPPVEGSVRTPRGRIESVIPVDYPPSEVTVSGIPEVSSGVPVQRDDISNWRVNQEHELRKALEREETEPELQSIDTSMLSRLIPSAQASDLAPLPPPQIGPTQIEQPEVGPSLLEPPPIPIKAKTIDLPGGKIVDGELILDESPEAWAEFINRKVEVPRVERTEEAAPEEKGGLLDDLESLNREDILSNILDLIVPEAGAADTPPVTVKNYTPDKFLENWEKYYWAGEGAGKDPKKDLWLSDAKDRMKTGTVFPKKRSRVIKTAIDAAVNVFGGDYGKDKSKRYSASRLRKDLINTGWVESNYSTVKNSQGGSDSGYWQVQPNTAYDLLRSAKAHFVIKNGTSKFEQEFGDYDELLKLSRAELKKRMRDEDDQRLAAAFAALKILTTFDQE